MVPQFALDLSMDGIALLARNPDGTWTRRGAVRLDDSDFAGSIARLRERCVTMAGADFTTWLIIPDSQLLFTTFERDDRRPEETIRQNLVGRTPYEVADLVFDYIERGDRLEVVVVARETLGEAESFAEDHGFRPVALTANPADGQYRIAPWFGPTEAAMTRTDGHPVTRLDALFTLTAPAPAEQSEPMTEASDAATGTESVSADSPGGLGGNPEDVAHVAELLAAARPTDPAPVTDAADAASPSVETGLPAQAGSRDADKARDMPTAPSFSSRRRNPAATLPGDSEGTAGLDRIAPRLTGVTRAPVRRATSPDLPSPVLAETEADAPVATASSSETAIAKAARLAGPARQSEGPSRDPGTDTAPALRAERGTGSRGPEPAPEPVTEPKSQPTLVPDMDQDEFILDPMLAARAGAPRRPQVLTLAAATALVALLGVGAWTATSYLGASGSDSAGTEAGGTADVATAELAALLPPGGTSLESETEIAAPAPIRLDAETEGGAAAGDATPPVTDQDTVTALLDVPGLAPRAEVDPDGAGVAGAEADSLPTAQAAPDLPRLAAPEQDGTTRDGPATPGATVAQADAGAEPAPAPQAEAASGDAGPGPADTTVVATAGEDPAPTPSGDAGSTRDPLASASADAPVLSLLTEENTAQAAALEALLAAPVEETARLDPTDSDAVAAASALATAEETEGLQTVAASSTASETSRSAAEGLLAGQDASGAAADIQVIAGRPEVMPEPRPEVENVIAVAASSGAAPQVDPEEEARRAVLARVRPVIRPRSIEPAAPEADAPEADTALPPEAPVETAEVAPDTEAVAALRGTRPQPRPATLSVPEAAPEPEAEAPVEEDPAVIAAEQAATASLAAARAAAAAADRAAEEVANVSPLALARSERPDTRPRAVERTAARIVERRREAAATPASAPTSAPASSTARAAPAETSSPTIRSAGGSVARAATQPNQIRLNRIALIGTYGSSSSRRALVRMGNGRYVKVEVGDRLDRGQVIAIGDGVVRYQRGGRNLELTLPPV